MATVGKVGTDIVPHRPSSSLIGTAFAVSSLEKLKMAHHPHHKHLHQRKSTEPSFNVDTDDPVIRACEHQWDAHKSDCSGFVRAVATELGISLSGNANQLVALMNSSSQWRDLGTDASQAMSYANNGYLVVAGLATSGHGHVAVVVRANSSIPIAYWGKLHSVGRKHASIHYSWNAHDLKHVSYFARTV